MLPGAAVPLFLSNVDLALTRQMLLSSVWGIQQDTSTRTLDAHVSKLRSKCEADPNTPRHLVTVHGVGCRFLMQTQQLDLGSWLSPDDHEIGHGMRKAGAGAR